MDARSAPGYGRASQWLGWIIAGLYAGFGVLTVVMPRTEKTSLLREDLRSWHYLVGLVLFALLLWRLARWLRERPVPAPAGLAPAAHCWARGLAGATYLVLALAAPLGLLYAWSEGLVVRLGPFLTLSALVPTSHAGWMFFGYFHSALGFVAMLLTVATAATAAWFWLRRGVGLVRAFAPGFGVQAYLSLLVTTYALASFRAPAPGWRALGVLAALTVALWALGAWLATRRARRLPPAARPAGSAARFATAVGLVALVGYGLYGPHLLFRVTPWPMGEAVAGPDGVTWHAAPVVQVSVAPETEFERQVAAETYRWCRFCHTVQAGERHLVGPNLHAIFGQQAGTVPNFHYSRAMAQAGREGLVWTDETLDAFLADPDKFVPGTSMIISSGPVRTAAERAAVINLLKRETMPASATGDATPR